MKCGTVSPSPHAHTPRPKGFDNSKYINEMVLSSGAGTQWCVWASCERQVAYSAGVVSSAAPAPDHGQGPINIPLCKGGVICISKVIDISPGNLDSSLYFFQSSISHDVLCIEVTRRQWHPTPVLLPGESQGWGSLVGSHRVRHD